MEVDAAAGSYAHRGAPEPLMSCVDSRKLDMSAFRRSAVDQVTVYGTVYGAPEFTILQVVPVNERPPTPASARPTSTPPTGRASRRWGRRRLMQARIYWY